MFFHLLSFPDIFLKELEPKSKRKIIKYFFFPSNPHARGAQGRRGVAMLFYGGWGVAVLFYENILFVSFH